MIDWTWRFLGLPAIFVFQLQMSDIVNSLKNWCPLQMEDTLQTK
jgi:hypothetical protein